MSTYTTKTRVMKSLSLNGRIGLKLKLFNIWFDGDIPKAQINLWNPLSYIYLIVAISVVSLWKIMEAVKEVVSLVRESYFGVNEYRKLWDEPTWFKDLPEN